MKQQIIDLINNELEGLHLIAYAVPTVFFMIVEIGLLLTAKIYFKDKQYKEWIITFIINTLLLAYFIYMDIRLQGGFHFYYKGEQYL